MSDQRSDANYTMQSRTMPELYDNSPRSDARYEAGTLRALKARRITNAGPHRVYAQPDQLQTFPGPETPDRTVPRQVEAFSFPRMEMPPQPEPQAADVRIASEADIDWMLSWGIQKFISRYPSLTPERAEAFLRLGMYDQNYRLVRTKHGAAMFMAARTPWEPELTVSDVFVAMEQPAVRELIALYDWGFEWSKLIRAVEFQFGSSTGVDITPIAERIGYDYKMVGFIKRTASVRRGKRAPRQ